MSNPNRNSFFRAKPAPRDCITLGQKEMTMTKALLLAAIDKNDPDECQAIVEKHFWSLEQAKQGDWLGLREQGLSLFEYASTKQSHAALAKLISLAITSIHIHAKANYVYLPNTENPQIPFLHVLAFSDSEKLIINGYNLIKANLPVGALAEAIKLARQYKNTTAEETFKSFLIGPNSSLFAPLETSAPGDAQSQRLSR